VDKLGLLKQFEEYGYCICPECGNNVEIDGECECGWEPNIFGIGE